MKKLENLEAQYWGETILSHPEYEEQCPWKKLNAASWHDILLEHPEFIRHAERITSSFMNARQWLEVLIRHPELDKYVPNPNLLFESDSVVIGRLWGILLSRHPEFAKYKPWKHLRHGDWKRLLSQQPQFMTNYINDRCMARSMHIEAREFTLGSDEQAEVIACQPSLFEHFNTKHYSSQSWVTILSNQPQLREKCSLHASGDLIPEDLGLLLKRHPEWLDYCETYSRSPKDILRIAAVFPEIINHYDLERIKDISYGDTPWMEVFPSLVPYSHWDFSYSYWDALLTRLSTWFDTGKRTRISSFFKDDDKPASSRGRITRPLPSNPKEKTIRNSLDSIMEYRFWYSRRTPEERLEVIPKRIREFVMDNTMTYEQMMIQLSMMPPSQEKSLIFYGLFLNGGEIIDRFLVDSRIDVLNIAPIQMLLPLGIMYVSKEILEHWLSAIHDEDSNAIASFRDKAGNNALHYLYFRGDWNHDYIEDLVEQREPKPEPICNDILEILLQDGVDPNKPNKMGFSYNMLCQTMNNYLNRRQGCLG